MRLFDIEASSRWVPRVLRDPEDEPAQTPEPYVFEPPPEEYMAEEPYYDPSLDPDLGWQQPEPGQALPSYDWETGQQAETPIFEEDWYTAPFDNSQAEPYVFEEPPPMPMPAPPVEIMDTSGGGGFQEWLRSPRRNFDEYGINSGVRDDPWSDWRAAPVEEEAPVEPVEAIEGSEWSPGMFGGEPNAEFEEWLGSGPSSERYNNVWDSVGGQAQEAVSGAMNPWFERLNKSFPWERQPITEGIGEALGGLGGDVFVDMYGKTAEADVFDGTVFSERWKPLGPNNYYDADQGASVANAGIELPGMPGYDELPASFDNGRAMTSQGIRWLPGLDFGGIGDAISGVGKRLGGDYEFASDPLDRYQVGVELGAAGFEEFAESAAEGERQRLARGQFADETAGLGALQAQQAFAQTGQLPPGYMIYDGAVIEAPRENSIAQVAGRALEPLSWGQKYALGPLAQLGIEGARERPLSLLLGPGGAVASGLFDDGDPLGNYEDARRRNAEFASGEAFDMLPGWAQPLAGAAYYTATDPLTYFGPGAAKGAIGRLGMDGSLLGRGAVNLLDSGGPLVALGGNVGGAAAVEEAQRLGIDNPMALLALGLAGGVAGGIGGGLTPGAARRVPGALGALEGQAVRASNAFVEPAPGGRVVRPMIREIEPGVTLYHGTPIEFEGFPAESLTGGSGPGAYFTPDEAIAEKYRSFQRTGPIRGGGRVIAATPTETLRLLDMTAPLDDIELEQAINGFGLTVEQAGALRAMHATRPFVGNDLRETLQAFGVADFDVRRMALAGTASNWKVGDPDAPLLEVAVRDPEQRLRLLNEPATVGTAGHMSKPLEQLTDAEINDKLQKFEYDYAKSEHEAGAVIDSIDYLRGKLAKAQTDSESPDYFGDDWTPIDHANYVAELEAEFSAQQKQLDLLNAKESLYGQEVERFTAEQQRRRLTSAPVGGTGPLPPPMFPVRQAAVPPVAPPPVDVPPVTGGVEPPPPPPPVVGATPPGRPDFTPILTALREERALRETGQIDREIHSGRLAQEKNLADARAEGQRQGLRGQELAEFVKWNAGEIKQSAVDTAAIDDPLTDAAIDHIYKALENGALKGSHEAQSLVDEFRRFRETGKTEPAVNERLMRILGDPNPGLSVEVKAALDVWGEQTKQQLARIGADDTVPLSMVRGALPLRVADELVQARGRLEQMLKTTRSLSNADAERLAAQAMDQQLSARFPKGTPERVEAALRMWDMDPNPPTAQQLRQRDARVDELLTKGNSRELAEETAQRELDKKRDVNKPGKASEGLADIVSKMKNTMFGLGDFGVILQQEAAALGGANPQILAAGVNRTLNKMGLGVDIYGGGAQNPAGQLSPAQQRILAGVQENARTGAVGDVREQGTIFRAFDFVPGVPKANRLVDIATDWVTEQQYGKVLGTTRSLIYEGNLLLLKAAGKDIYDPAVQRAAADQANAVTSAAMQARRAKRATAEGAALLSPSMTRAQGQVIVQVARTAEILKGKPAGIMGAATIVSLVGATLLAAEASRRLLGDYRPFEMDPSKPDFGKITFPNGLVLDLFPQKQVADAVAQSIQHLATGDPKAVAEAWGKVALGRGSPVITLAGKAVGFGIDEHGYHFGDYGKDSSTWDRIVASLPVPPIAGALKTQINKEGGQPGDWKWDVLGAQFLGGNAYRESPFRTAAAEGSEAGLYPAYRQRPDGSWERVEGGLQTIDYKSLDPLARKDTILRTPALKDAGNTDRQIAEAIEGNRQAESSFNALFANGEMTVGQWREDRKRYGISNAAIFDMIYEDKKERPAENGPEQWTYDYYATFRAATDPVTKQLDDDKLQELQANFWASHNNDPVIRKYLFDLTTAGDDPVAKEYLGTLSKLNGYDPETGMPNGEPNYFELRERAYPLEKVSNETAHKIVDIEFENWKKVNRIPPGGNRTALLNVFLADQEPMLAAKYGYTPEAKAELTLVYGKDMFESPELKAYKAKHEDWLAWFNPDLYYPTLATLNTR